MLEVEKSNQPLAFIQARPAEGLVFGLCLGVVVVFLGGRREGGGWGRWRGVARCVFERGPDKNAGSSHENPRVRSKIGHRALSVGAKRRWNIKALGRKPKATPKKNALPRFTSRWPWITPKPESKRACLQNGWTPKASGFP